MWSIRVRAVTELQASSNADLEAAYAGYAKAHAEGGGWYAIPPLEVVVARAYLKRGFSVESVPALLLKRLEEIEQLENGWGDSDLYTRDDSVMSNLKSARLEAWPMAADAYARLKQPDLASKETRNAESVRHVRH